MPGVAGCAIEPDKIMRVFKYDVYALWRDADVVEDVTRASCDAGSRIGVTNLQCLDPSQKICSQNSPLKQRSSLRLPWKRTAQ